MGDQIAFIKALGIYLYIYYYIDSYGYRICRYQGTGLHETSRHVSRKSMLIRILRERSA